MDVRIARPIDANRVVLSKSCGSYVSMMQGTDGVIVERLQRIAPEKDRRTQDFTVCGRSWPAHGTAYHLIRHLSLSLGKSLFPGNFPDALELRFFKMRGKRYSAAYHPYVDDANGVLDRKKAALCRYYSSHDAPDRAAMLERAAKQEYLLNPDLAAELEKLTNAGIIIQEPEWDYRISGGNTIFLGVAGLDLQRAFSCARSREDQLSAAYLSLIATVLLKAISCADACLYGNGRRNPLRSFQDERIERIHATVLSLALSPDWTGPLPHRIEDCEKGFDHWHSASSSAGVPINGLGISQKLGSTLERVLQNQF